MLMGQVDTLHVSRYWSAVLCRIITTHLDDIELKVMDLEIFCFKLCLLFFYDIITSILNM